MENLGFLKRRQFSPDFWIKGSFIKLSTVLETFTTYLGLLRAKALSFESLLKFFGLSEVGLLVVTNRWY